jgi:hypothetical protein
LRKSGRESHKRTSKSEGIEANGNEGRKKEMLEKNPRKWRSDESLKQMSGIEPGRDTRQQRASRDLD